MSRYVGGHVLPVRKNPLSAAAGREPMPFGAKRAACGAGRVLIQA